MRIFKVLLALCLWLALCSAYPKKQDDRRRIEDSNALALLREPRSITADLISNLENTAVGILRLPVDSTVSLSQLISFVVQFIIDWLIRVPFRRPLVIAARYLNILSSTFPTSFTNLPKTVNAVTDYVREGATNFLEQAISMLWRFLSTTGLPWLRRFLDQVVKLPYIPAPIQAMIQNFIAVYNLAQLLGLVSPAY